MLFEVFADFCQVVSKKIHHDQILFTVLHEIINIANVLQALQINQYIILEDENALVFVLLFDFQGDVFFEGVVVGLVNKTKSSLSQLLFQIKPLGNLQGVLEVVVRVRLLLLLRLLRRRGLLDGLLHNRRRRRRSHLLCDLLWAGVLCVFWLDVVLGDVLHEPRILLLRRLMKQQRFAVQVLHWRLDYRVLTLQQTLTRNSGSVDLLRLNLD